MTMDVRTKVLKKPAAAKFQPKHGSFLVSEVPLACRCPRLWRRRWMLERRQQAAKKRRILQRGMVRRRGRRARSRFRSSRFWVAVKEIKSNYHNSETISFSTYVHIYVYGHPLYDTHTPQKHCKYRYKRHFFRIQFWSCFCRLETQV